MRYELMVPDQIREAIDANWPVVLPIGVLKYHGEHMAVGMDTLAVVKALELVEREIDIVLLPPFSYGAASYAITPPERMGTLHIDAARIAPLAEDLFAGLLRVGFRNIHCVIHHQTESFAEGMPTDLAFRFAARQATFRYLDRERGEGWFGKPEMARFYAERAAGTDPFSWIRLHALIGPEIDYPFDHAGIGETSLMLALCPEAVDMDRVTENSGWYSESAGDATLELGEKGRDLILARLRRLLSA